MALSIINFDIQAVEEHEQGSKTHERKSNPMHSGIN